MDPPITIGGYPRFDAYLPVQCTVPVPGRTDQKVLPGKTQSVSAGGLQVLLPETLPIRTPLVVRIGEGDPLRAYVVSVHQATSTSAGSRVAHGVAFERAVDPGVVSQWVYHAQRQVHARAPVLFAVDFTQAGTAGHGTCLNLSRGGMFIATTNPANPGSQLALTFTLPNLSHTFSILARVVWRRQVETTPFAGTGMGVQFLDPKPSESALIGALVDRLCSESPPSPDASGPVSQLG
jgi:uncharacterized protein (TIGR02266 family)